MPPGQRFKSGRTYHFLNASFGEAKPKALGFSYGVRESFSAALGRLHSLNNGSFREAKIELPLYGNELGDVYFASRP
jgi:hypothetical protein